jgi:hypothetical protein
VKTNGLAVDYCTGKTEFSTPPRNGSTSLLPQYYNDYPPETDGEIDCVAESGPPVFPSNPLYPDSCTRLRANNTFVRITYTAGSITKTQVLPMSDTVGCRVTAGCQG